MNDIKTETSLILTSDKVKQIIMDYFSGEKDE